MVGPRGIRRGRSVGIAGQFPARIVRVIAALKIELTGIGDARSPGTTVAPRNARQAKLVAVPLTAMLPRQNPRNTGPTGPLPA
jgi:hypothetical protein